MKSGLYHGDCQKLFAQVADGSVQCAIADPPYNIGYDYAGEYDDSLPAGQYIGWSRDWMQALRPKLSPDGAFWLVISDEYVAELKVEAERLGYRLRSWCIWYFTFGVHCTDKPSRCHQHILFFGTGLKTPRFYRENVLVPSARQARYNDKRAANGGKTPNDVWILFPDQLPESATQADLDVWLASRIAGTFGHRAPDAPNQLPEQIVGRMMLMTTQPGDLVLDPFAGSGTTPVVAKKLERLGIGFEQSAKTCKRAQTRFDSVSAGDPLT